MTRKARVVLDRYYSKYGLTYKQYCEKAVNGCELCGKKPKKGQRRLAVDHSHASGVTRGILCYYCNFRRVGKLNLEWCKRILVYLEKYEGEVEGV